MTRTWAKGKLVMHIPTVQKCLFFFEQLGISILLRAVCHIFTVDLHMPGHPCCIQPPPLHGQYRVYLMNMQTGNNLYASMSVGMLIGSIMTFMRSRALSLLPGSTFCWWVPLCSPYMQSLILHSFYIIHHCNLMDNAIFPTYFVSCAFHWRWQPAFLNGEHSQFSLWWDI